MVGLIAYPTILEPYFSLADQSHSWFYGYLALIAFTSACVLFLWRFFFAQAQEDSPKLQKVLEGCTARQMNSSEVTLARRIRWVVLSFVPSSLLLGVTAEAVRCKGESTRAHGYDLRNDRCRFGTSLLDHSARALFIVFRDNVLSESLDSPFVRRSPTGFLVVGRRDHSVCPSDQPWMASCAASSPSVFCDLAGLSWRAGARPTDEPPFN